MKMCELSRLGRSIRRHGLGLSCKGRSSFFIGTAVSRNKPNSPPTKLSKERQKESCCCEAVPSYCPTFSAKRATKSAFRPETASPRSASSAFNCPFFSEICQKVPVWNGPYIRLVSFQFVLCSLPLIPLNEWNFYWYFKCYRRTRQHYL